MIEIIATHDFLSDSTIEAIPHAGRLNTAMQVAFCNLPKETFITPVTYVSGNLEMVTSEDFIGLFGKAMLPLGEALEKVKAMEAELDSISCDTLANMFEYLLNGLGCNI